MRINSNSVDHQQCGQRTQFCQNFPAVDLITKHYSLQADMINGWRPKFKVLGPIPLNFDSQVQDELIDQLTSFGSKYKERVIYLGNRYLSSFKMHQEMNHQYQFKHQNIAASNYIHMAAYFRKFHTHFKPKFIRLFKGMNPTIKIGQQLIFDSNFQCGNLDAAIRINQNQYDLFMRVDTNTKGHVQWFNFTIKNCGKKKVKFNIVNMKKLKSLYIRGMKPYIYSEILKQKKQIGWHQGGQNIKYLRKKLNYSYLDDYFSNEVLTYNCLQFQYVFENQWQIVSFAYNPPYTYSNLLELIKKLKLLSLNNKQQQFISCNNLCQSLGGLDIPLLTITNPLVDNKKKKCILISGRIHPGQTCGSYMMKGLLEYLCSQEAQFLRRNIIFKIIPMLNPDGVIVGNFRTSLCGKDLNRTFKQTSDIMIPEIKHLKELVIYLKNQYKNKLIFFLDLHGHSIKKNIFLYGPDYQIWQNNYYKTRIFPKILSMQTNMFRYYSCLFRIADFKRTTGRAVILKNIPHCYTIQASSGFYYSIQDKKDIPFTIEKWEEMGNIIGTSLKEYMELLYDEQISRSQRKQKISEIKTMKNKYKNKKNNININNNTNNTNNNNYITNNNTNTNIKKQNKIITFNSTQKSRNTQQILQDKNKQQYIGISKKTRNIIQQIKIDEFQRKQYQENNNESDNFSQGGSDSQDSEQDISKQNLKQLHNEIINSMKDFKQLMSNNNNNGDRKYSIKQKCNNNVMKKNNNNQIKQTFKTNKIKEIKCIQMIPSLRKKAQQIDKIKPILIWPKIKQISISTNTNTNNNNNMLQNNNTKNNNNNKCININSKTKFKINLPSCIEKIIQQQQNI